jgi:hypothetical protein
MSSKENKSQRANYILVGLIILCVGLWGLTWYLSVRYIDKPGDQGTFGDMFGSVNALFSGLAFAGVIYAIYLQREDLKLQQKDLKLQREELRLTREELNKTTEAHIKANEHSKEQIRLNNLPVFKIDKTDMNRTYTVTNTSDRIAFDVEINTIRIFHNNIMSIVDFANRYTDGQTIRRIESSSGQVDRWGLEQTYKWNLWSPKEALSCEIGELNWYGVKVIIQYKDVLGNNYLQYTHFAKNDEGELFSSKNIHFGHSAPLLYERFDIKTIDADSQLPEWVLDQNLIVNMISNVDFTNQDLRELQILWYSNNDRGSYLDDNDGELFVV